MTDAPRTVIVKTSWATLVAIYNADDLPVRLLRFAPGAPLPASLTDAELINVTEEPFPPFLADTECEHGEIIECLACEVPARPVQVTRGHHKPKEAGMTVKEMAIDVIRETLADGPVAASTLNEALAAAGVKLSNVAAIATARKELGVVAFRKPGEKGWFASLPLAIPDTPPAAPELAARARQIADELLDQAREVRDAHARPPVEPLVVDAGSASVVVEADEGVTCVVCHVETELLIAGVPLCEEHLDRWDEALV